MKTLLAAILLFAFPVLADFQVPELNHPVNDYANVLTRGGKERIALEIVHLKNETGSQVGVVIVESLDGESIEQATMKVARKWRLGSKDKDNGAVFLIATKDRKFRLEVGYGLEGIVTDYHASQITTSMRDFLKVQNYDEAILTGVMGISSRIKAHADEITSKSNIEHTTDSGFPLGYFFLLILAVAGVGTLFVYLRIKYYKDAEQKEREREARRLAKQPLTPEQKKLSALMAADLEEHVRNNPIKPTREYSTRRNDDDDSFVSGVVVGSLLNSSRSESRYESSSSSDSSNSSSSSSDFSGGGGDFGGGGSSDSY